MSRIARPSIADPLIADSSIAELIADSLIAALFWLKFGLVLVNK
jgi:hypothetical protein